MADYMLIFLWIEAHLEFTTSNLLYKTGAKSAGTTSTQWQNSRFQPLAQVFEDDLDFQILVNNSIAFSDLYLSLFPDF